MQPLVLILERDPAVGASLAFSLRLEGFEVEVRASPASLADAPLADAACMLLDADHPDLRPLEMLRSLRARGLAAPVIFTATHPKRRLLTQVEAVEARLLEKPWTGDGLIAEIRRALTHWADRREVSPTS